MTSGLPIIASRSEPVGGGGTAAPDQAATPNSPAPAAKSIKEMTYEERVAHHAGRQRDPKRTQGRRPTRDADVSSGTRI